jgi:hypothetical protein
VHFNLPIACAQGTTAQEPYLSLDLFGRPYMNSISEGEFQKLSPQDQEKAMAEIMESCRQTRSQLKETITQAQACAAGDDPRRAEAYLIPALEHGRPRQIAVGAGATAADRCRGQGDPQHGSTGRTVIRPNDLYRSGY